MEKNLPVNAEDATDVGSIPRLGRFSAVGNGNLFQYSCWKIPWTEEPGGQRWRLSPVTRFSAALPDGQQHRAFGQLGPDCLASSPTPSLC